MADWGKQLVQGGNSTLHMAQHLNCASNQGISCFLQFSGCRGRFYLLHVREAKDGLLRHCNQFSHEILVEQPSENLRPYSEKLCSQAPLPDPCKTIWLSNTDNLQIENYFIGCTLRETPFIGPMRI
jgi:hypothetical protein